jgi:hypothetical protein
MPKVGLTRSTSQMMGEKIRERKRIIGATVRAKDSDARAA